MNAIGKASRSNKLRYLVTYNTLEGAWCTRAGVATGAHSHTRTQTHTHTHTHARFARADYHRNTTLAQETIMLAETNANDHTIYIF